MLARNGENKMVKRKTIQKKDAFVSGGIFAVLGLYLIAFVHDLQGGFVLLGNRGCNHGFYV